MVREAGYVAAITAERPAIRSPIDAVQLMAPIAARELAEVFFTLLLDSQHRLLAIPTKNDRGEPELVAGPVVVTRGIINSSLAHPREVFRAAVVYGASAVILVHQHPSGDPTPSADDRLVTQQLVAAGRLVDIPVHDHIVLGSGGRYTSFAEAGLL
ncbi:MAG TPA: JAB domain-containing protein [Gemmatimonadaceae bacterium]|nr:JAB domain-containing protein [Gemmatimonadaceae bacterium]